MSLLRYLLLTVLVAGCGNGEAPQLELAGDAMGTTFRIAIVEAPDTFDADGLEAAAVESLTRIDRLASTWRDDSQLSAFNANPSVDWILVSAELCAALESALQIGDDTGGAFDITVGPVVNLWGFGPAGQVQEPPSDHEIETAMQSVGHAKLETDCQERLVRKDGADVYVDLSGWAKGLAVDELAELLETNGLDNFLVEVGGEIRVKGHNREGLNWAVAIEAPSTSERKAQAVVRVTDTAVATSGDYRNYFEYGGRHYSHTIDPRTGYPVQHKLAAVSVVHASAAYADAMATALLVLGPKAGPELAERLDIAGYFLLRNDTGVEAITSAAFDGLEST